MTVDPSPSAREAALTDEVVASFAGTPDSRLREILESVTRHLHAVVRETRLTEAEWEAAIGFLTATGHITDDRRQEFILLSDVLGVSMQTITVNDTAAGDVTEATVWGPFFVDGSPEVALGGDVAQGAPGEPCWVEGTVRSADGTPLPGALIEVWEADDDGFYDVQYADGRTSARGHLVADDAGRYRFWALTPTPYPIPADGPVGRLLAATDRSPMRAPHLHFMVTADGHRRVVSRGARRRRQRVRGAGLVDQAVRAAGRGHGDARRPCRRRLLVARGLRHRAGTVRLTAGTWLSEGRRKRNETFLMTS